MRAALLVVLCATAGLAGCTTPRAISACSTSADCPASEQCVDGTCVPRLDAAVGCDGACECASDADCRDTIPPCADAACVGGTCFARPVDTRCAAGERCDATRGCVGADTDAGGLLDAAASDGGDAGSSDAAATDAGPDAPADAFVPADARGALGEPCTTDADCAPLGGGGTSPRCLLTISGTTFDGGYCSSTCSSVGMSCGTNGECVLVGGGSFTPMCFQRCMSGSECRAGYRCERIGILSSDSVCAPPGL